MSKRMYTTAQGKEVSIESIRLENEDVIAVGNMKINARGDSLGPGGVVEATRQEMVNEYYNLHTPTVGAETQPALTPRDDAPAADMEYSRRIVTTPVNADPRGSMSGAAAPEAKVEQKLMRTAKQQVKDRGPQRF
jgi:hypothetical protein